MVFWVSDSINNSGACNESKNTTKKVKAFLSKQTYIMLQAILDNSHVCENRKSNKPCSSDLAQEDTTAGEYDQSV